MTRLPSQKELMLAGKLYLSADPELAKDRLAARKLIRQFNTNDDTRDEVTNRALLKKLLGLNSRTDSAYIEPPFNVDYGYNLTIGKNFYANFNLAALDCNRITIGDHVMFGPNVALYAATHPTDPAVRRNGGPELAFPITIGSDVWIGGNVVVLPGVTIGDGVTIGAGSVVTKDIPSHCIAVGNPCRVIKHLPNLSADAEADHREEEKEEKGGDDDVEEEEDVHGSDVAGGADVGGGGVPPEGPGWRLSEEPRRKIIHKIIETLQRCVHPGPTPAVEDLREMATSFENRIYTEATDQDDYLRRISLKMLQFENRGQAQWPGLPGGAPTGNDLGPNSVGRKRQR